MKKLRHVSKRYWGASPTGFLVVFIVALAFGAHAISASTSISPEVKFTDASASGLQIVPASCPSSPDYPGECDPPSPPTNIGATCDSSSHTATMSWTEPAGTTYSMVRVSDTAFPWTGQCGADGIPGSWCFNNTHPN